MKRILSAVVLCIAIMPAIYGQPEPLKDNRSKIHLGIKAGVNNSNVYDSYGKDFNAEPKLGFAGGAFLSVPIGKYLGVQPAVLISQKGFHGTGMLMENKYDLKRTTTFLDVPVLVEFKPVGLLTLVGGPQYSYLLNQTDIVKSESGTSVQEQEFKNDDIRKNLLSGVVGLDLNIGKIVLSGRYNFDLQRNNGSSSSETPRYKNIWLQGTIGLRF
jgi:hypothetical protein